MSLLHRGSGAATVGGVLASAVLAPWSAVPPAAASELGGTCITSMTSVQCTFAADTTFTVPAWVTSLVVDAVGGNGAAAVGAGSLGSGANGSELQTRLNVAPNSPLFPGQVLTVQIGGNAVGITGGAHGGGDGDYNGAPASADEVWSGGGGGATSLLGTADHVLAAAGGGGGGGGAGACTSDPCSGGSGGAGLDPTGQDGEGPTGASGGHGGALSDGGAGGAGTTSYGAGGFSPVGQQGGDGGPSTLTGPGGGGGGGYAGGGGGGAGGTDGSNFGGGGGGAGGSSHPDVSIAQNEFVSVGDGTPRLTIAYDKQNPTLTVAPTPSAAPQGTASQAVVSLGGVVPTGTITFELHAFSGGTCSGDPLSSTSIHVGDAGTYYGPLVQPPYGTYSWSASYSGDDDTLPAAVACGDPGTILTVQDLTAPAASLTSTGPATQLGSSIPVAWSATDSISGVASYDVRDKRAAWNGSFGSAALWRSETTSTSGAFPASSGYEYCFSVRARDNAGNVSPWSGWKCAARPLDDRSLTRSTGWSRTSISSFYLGTATTTTKAGRSLTRTGAIAGRAVLVAGTGPRQGRVTVYYNGKAVKTLSLASTTSHSRVLFSLPKLTRATTVVIKTLDAKTVRIDGLLLARV